MKNISRLLLILPLVLLLSCARMEYVEKQLGYSELNRPLIKVRVFKGSDPVVIDCQVSFTVRTWSKDGQKSTYFSATPLKVGCKKHTLQLFDPYNNLLETNLNKVTVVPRKEKMPLRLNKKKFRGIFEFYADDKTQFYVVNILHIEDYLKGVLPPEIGKRKKNEFDALMVQAVAARTYALSTVGKYPDKEYDLINDIRDQVYQGIKGETKQTNKAIQNTKGEAITFQGELAEAYYHSTCGGMTDNIEDVWERQPLPYLQATNDLEFCRWSKFYDWNELYSAKELLSHIRSYLQEKNKDDSKLGNILKGIEVLKRTTAGRVKTLQVITEAGKITLFKDQIRWAFKRHGRTGIMPSTNIKIDLEYDSNGNVAKIHVAGYGYGHGLGMCQCGAIGMARAGFGYKKILNHYYSGAKIEKLY